MLSRARELSTKDSAAMRAAPIEWTHLLVSTKVPRDRRDSEEATEVPAIYERRRVMSTQ